MLSDEAATLQQLNRLCGSENVFSHTRVPRRRILVEVPAGGADPTPQIVGDGLGADRDVVVRSKILSHFIKGRISLSPMETILLIPGELEHLESLVKLARRRKDTDVHENQVSMVSVAPTLKRVRHGPGANVEVLPLTMVNMLQRVNSEAQIKKPTTTWQSASTRDNPDWVEDHDQTIETQEDMASSSDFDACTNSNEHGEEGSSPERRVDYEDEFGEGELEKLVESEGPPEILQLILQEQADDFMNEEISEGDDYADWMQWVRDAEQSRRTERAPDVATKISLQRAGQMNTPSIATLRQVM
ncbi:unnamed protein product [Sphagnum jensenii]